MITMNVLKAMRQVERNLLNEGQVSRSECVGELIDELTQSRMLLLECRNAFDTIHKAAMKGFNDEVLLTSGVLEGKLSRLLEIE